MKSFLSRLLVVAIIPVTFCVLLEITYGNVPNAYQAKKEQVKSQRGTLKTLILGPSLTERGINPELLSSNSYNLSFPNQSLKYSCMLLEKYAKKGLLTNAIVSVTYDDFRKTLEDRSAQRVAFYHKTWGKPYEKLFIEHSRGILLIKKIIEHQNGKLAPNKFNDDGFKPYSEKENAGDFIERSTEIANQGNTRYSKKVKENLAYLESAIEACQKYNIKLTFVTLPAHESIIEKVDKEQLAEMNSLCMGLAKANEGVSYYNFFNDDRFSKNTANFYDAVHLKSEGSSKFTAMLNQQLLDDGILNNTPDAFVYEELEEDNILEN